LTTSLLAKHKTPYEHQLSIATGIRLSCMNSYI